MTMEFFEIENNIPVICVTATSFPGGVMEAFKKLNNKINGKKGRTEFGISYMDNKGQIIYKAAVNELEKDEAEKLGIESFTIRKGTYLSEIVKDFMENIPAMRETFRNLLKDPRLDRNGYCVEIYFNEKDVRCMVTL
jgi:predicted transcriptional regulator YdeE